MTSSTAAKLLAFAGIALLGVVSGCSGDSSPTRPTPTAPPTVPPAPSPAPAPNQFTGTVTNTVTGAPVAGFTAVLNGSRVTVSAPGYVTRETTNRSTVDLIPNSSPFDLTFYRQFVRGGLGGATLQPIRRQAQSFRLFVKTVDESGRPIDSSTINVVTNTITNALVETYSGGAIHLLSVEQGTGSRIGTPGWVTVRWVNAAVAAYCMTAAIAGDWIEVVNAPNCGCRPGIGTYPRGIRAVLGNTMGFYSTDGSNDVMYRGGANGADCENSLSERERYHAAIAYKRPSGNRDIDIDP